jgi:hypothetical protein
MRAGHGLTGMRSSYGYAFRSGRVQDLATGIQVETSSYGLGRYRPIDEKCLFSSNKNKAILASRCDNYLGLQMFRLSAFWFYMQQV